MGEPLYMADRLEDMIEDMDNAQIPDFWEYVHGADIKIPVELNSVKCGLLAYDLSSEGGYDFTLELQDGELNEQIDKQTFKVETIEDVESSIREFINDNKPIDKTN
jgi:hypothetical protein